MKHTSLTQRLVALVVLCALISACGTAQADSNDDAAPLAEFFADNGGSLGAALEGWAQSIQLDAAMCMRQQGFDYSPITVSAELKHTESSDISEQEWTERFGYGISFSDTLLVDGVHDPNVETIGALGPAEKSVYYGALYGQLWADLILDGQLVDLPPVPLDEQGCIGVATIDNGGMVMAAGVQQVQASQASVLEQVYELPEVTAAVGAWSGCMSERGYKFASHEMATASISDSYTTVITPLYRSASDLSPDEARAAILGSNTTLVPDFDYEALLSLQRAEVALALADLGCFDLHVRSVLEPLISEAETTTVEDNRLILESIRDMLSNN